VKNISSESSYVHPVAIRQIPVATKSIS